MRWSWEHRRRRRPAASGISPDPLPGANSGPTWDRRRRGAGGRYVGRDVTDRFWERVYVTDGCWLWAGDQDKDGYGVFKVKGAGGWVPVAAHVWAWEQANGPVPDGHTLDHLCHSFDADCPPGPCLHRLCVRPGDLEPVTAGENRRRARARWA